MPEKVMRGNYPILVTPFDEQYRIDVDSLQNLIDFLIDNGVHGFGVAMGSEVFTFTDEERLLVTRTVVKQANGRVPVVINSGGNSTQQAVYYSRMAQENGADALMLIPPTAVQMGGPEMRHYYKAVSDIATVPIFIQDAHPHVAAELAVKIAEESEHVRYIKVESPPPPLMVQEAVEKAGHKLVVFGGAGGNYFVEEMRRGAVGTMPYCSQPEAFRQVWDLYHAGDEKGAIEVFYRRIIPINRLCGLGPAGAAYHVHKEVLRHRGAIRTSVVRGPIPPLNERVRREVQMALDELYPR